jgi:hypothetical protein
MKELSLVESEKGGGKGGCESPPHGILGLILFETKLYLLKIVSFFIFVMLKELCHIFPLS